MKETVIKEYKFRVYPTDEQKVFFAKHFGCTRFVYNHFLAMRRDAYKQDKTSISVYECNSMIPPMEKKSIADCGWSEFVRQLKYKARWKDSIIVQIGQWEPSSKLCSTPGCDYKHDSLRLLERDWTCPQCKIIHDRDINAARNVQQIGLEAPELTPVKKTTSVFSAKKIQVSSLNQESPAF